MVLVLRLVLSLLGLLFLFMGAQFLIDPAATGAGFGLDSIGAQGLAAIRGDMTAFFWVSGGCLLVGAWKGNRTALYVAAALMGIVFMGRALSAWVDGVYPLWYAPMIAEAFTVIVALIATRVLVRDA